MVFIQLSREEQYPGKYLHELHEELKSKAPVVCRRFQFNTLIDLEFLWKTWEFPYFTKIPCHFMEIWRNVWDYQMLQREF